MKSRINKLEYKFEINLYDSKFYYKNNKTHRDGDLPAIIHRQHSKIWYKDGLRHRDNNKPTRIYSNGDMAWYENGKLLKMNY